ncbi:MAG: LicD family protein [Lachnospiraceae bacterium]|nr:LicD family protein [Lachnospiraceae bacterium]
MAKQLPITIKLPDGFLNEEERCGHLISSDMKAVWAVQLDLLSRLQDVCQKHGLTYYAAGGTLLGAIRHKGYIPWDDDVDVVMFREDYEKLKTIADQEFSYPYFFQTIETDPLHIRGHAQFRNSETTGYITGEENLAINKGIFIDVFVLDRLPDRAFIRKLHTLWLRILFTILTYKRYGKDEERAGLSRLAGPLFRDVFFRFVDHRAMYRHYEKLCRKYNGSDDHTVSTVAFTQGRNRRYLYPKEWYDKTVEQPFEFINVTIPADYDAILRRLYGDYMTIVKGASLHGDVTFDPYHSYQTKKEHG